MPYKFIANFYDLLDFPHEYFYYRHWRPVILENITGNILEVGVGTGRNLKYYDFNNNKSSILAIDNSDSMLSKAQKRLKKLNKFNNFNNNKNLKTNIKLLKQDAANMVDIPSSSFDWIVATFVCCVIPKSLHNMVITEFIRVLKPGGKIRLVEIIYSKNKYIRFKQKLAAKYASFLFSAKFDGDVLTVINQSEKLKVIETKFLKDDTFLLITAQKL